MGIIQVLQGRKVIGQYQEAHLVGNQRQLEQDALQELNALGFKSFTDFYRANEESCQQEIERCFKLIGECDGCIGRKTCCANSRKVALPPNWVFYFRRMSYFRDKVSVCSIRFEQVANPELDIHWGAHQYNPTVFDD